MGERAWVAANIELEDGAVSWWVGLENEWVRHKGWERAPARHKYGTTYNTSVSQSDTGKKGDDQR